MMNKLRKLTFILHRYIGLVVGILLIVVGLTGSLLVFQHEIDRYFIQRQFGQVIPQQQRVSIESVLKTVTSNYSDRPDLSLSSIDTRPEDDTYIVQFLSKDDKRTDVFVNPYTGKIIGDRVWDDTPIGIIYRLHYSLLAGRIGEIIIGIAGLFLLILSITGIFLWSGWRKLLSGFKIKWRSHPKRIIFDIHKVAGIISAVFLAMNAFTGFCWNFSDFSKPAIYALTLTPNSSEPVSKFFPDNAPLEISEILKIADALPDAVTTFITLAINPEDAIAIYKKRPQELSDFGDTIVYLDQYSGNILKLQDGLNLSLGDKIYNSFTPLHYGTYWGLSTRILYVFVGLAPLILSITGYVVWCYRYLEKSINLDAIDRPLKQHR